MSTRTWQDVRAEAVASGRLDAHRYSVEWSAEDGEYVGTCDGFPSLSWLAPTQLDALAGIAALVREESSE